MYSAAIITLSDKGHAGQREDRSGAEIRDVLDKLGYVLAHYAVLPDEFDVITAELIRLCDAPGGDRPIHLILTTGGTGFAPRDVTPEATLHVAERLCPGIPEAMRAFSMAKTRRAMLTRGVAGIRGRTLIINLPGSPKAVRECLECISDQLDHALDILSGNASECARPPDGPK